MIQRAMKESHVNLKLNQPAKKQALETIAILKKTMRIERKQMLIRLVGRKRSRNVDSISHLAEGAIKELCEAEGIQIVSREEGEQVTFVLVIDTKNYKTVEAFCADHPSCTCEILQRQYIPEEKPTAPAAPVAPVAPATPAAPVAEAAAEPAALQTSRFKCSTCQAGFQDTGAYREHFRSDWHRFNLKRKNKGLSSLSEEDYNLLDDAERELFLSQDSIAT